MIKKNIKINYISFKDNLLEEVFKTIYTNFKSNSNSDILKNSTSSNKLFIFPNHYSKNEALKIYKNYWLFESSLFLTLEELKELILSQQTPIISEDKRKIVLFSCFYDNNKYFKKYFKITDYFSSINFLNSFFQFFEELTEELINPYSFLEDFFLTSHKLNLLQWQEDYLKKLIELLKDYENKLKISKRTDKIFSLINFIESINNKNKNIVFRNFETLFSKYDDIIIINQYYFTKFEKEIIYKISNYNKNIKIFLHLPEKLKNLYNETNLSFEPIDLTDKKIIKNLINEIKLNNVNIKYSNSQINSFFSLITEINNQSPSLIINNKFLFDKYKYFLNYNTLVKNLTIQFENTSIYSFFKSLLTIHKNSINFLNNKDSNNILLNIDSFIDALKINDFTTYFEIKSPFSLIEKLLILKKNGYIYINLNERLLSKPVKEQNLQYFHDSEVYQILDFIYNNKSFKNISKLTTSLYNVKSYKEFINILRNINYSKFKLYTTEEIDNIFISINDFNNIFNLKIIDESDFKQFFNETYGFALLKFILNYLKSKKINVKNTYYQKILNKNKFHDIDIKISNINNTRNVSFDSPVYIYNLIEGVLPIDRKEQFILNENQRSVLGLKTYNTIRQREKYYFIRLLLNTEKIVLFTIDDKKNFIPSSFLEEIKLFVQEYNILNNNNLNNNINLCIEEKLNIINNVKKSNNLTNVNKNVNKKSKYENLSFNKLAVFSSLFNLDFIDFTEFFLNNIGNKKLKDIKTTLELEEFNIDFSKKQPFNIENFIIHFSKINKNYVLETEKQTINEDISGIIFTFYKYKLFKEDGLTYFIKHLTDLFPYPIEKTNFLNSLIIGNIVHDLFKYTGTEFFYYIINNKPDTVSKNIKNFLNDILKTSLDQIFKDVNNSSFYKIPHNISKEYFINFHFPVIKNTAIHFYKWIYNNIFKNYLNSNFFKFSILIEGNIIYNDLLNNKKILSNNISFLNIPVSDFKTSVYHDYSIVLPNFDIYIKGIPDLSIIYKNNNKTFCYIFDFKTGNPKTLEQKIYKLQLKFYEFLITNLFLPVQINEIYSTFINVYSSNLGIKNIEKYCNKEKDKKPFDKEIIHSFLDFWSIKRFTSKRTKIDKEYLSIFYPE